MGTIYAIGNREHGWVKVGLTQGYARLRLIGIQTACPVDLEILYEKEGSFDEELRMQEALHDIHIRGEWFKLDESLLQKLFKEIS